MIAEVGSLGTPHLWGLLVPLESGQDGGGDGHLQDGERGPEHPEGLGVTLGAGGGQRAWAVRQGRSSLWAVVTHVGAMQMDGRLACCVPCQDITQGLRSLAITRHLPPCWASSPARPGPHPGAVRCVQPPCSLNAGVLCPPRVCAGPSVGGTRK